jgi:hypothetical protein
LEDSLLNSTGLGSTLSVGSSGNFSQGESDNENFVENSDYSMNPNDEFECGTCKKVFSKLVGLRSHEITHLGTVLLMSRRKK